MEAYIYKLDLDTRGKQTFGGDLTFTGTKKGAALLPSLSCYIVYTEALYKFSPISLIASNFRVLPCNLLAKLCYVILCHCMHAVDMQVNTCCVCINACI